MARHKSSAHQHCVGPPVQRDGGKIPEGSLKGFYTQVLIGAPGEFAPLIADRAVILIEILAAFSRLLLDYPARFWEASRENLEGLVLQDGRCNTVAKDYSTAEYELARREIGPFVIPSS